MNEKNTLIDVQQRAKANNSVSDALNIDKDDEMPLYQSQMAKQEKANSEEGKEKDEQDFLYEKEIECPVCFDKFQYLEIKSNSYGVEKIDSDFLRYCSNINPLFYGVIICQKCGYAGLKQYFNKVTPTGRKLIKEKITSKWQKREYPKKYDLDIAIERYKLSLLNAVTKMARSGEIADICLRLCWLYRLKEDSEKELHYMKQAIYGFKEALEKESNSVVGIDAATLTYLVGELSRRGGDFQTASIYFSQILFDKTAKPSLKEKARIQRDILKNQMEAIKTEDEDLPNGDGLDNKVEQANNGKKFFFF